jgi:glutamine amidotransferase
MCRLYAFKSNEPTRLKCSLVSAQNALMLQSVADKRGKEHADGWGVSCYDDTLPWLEKRDTAAYRDELFSLTAERIYARTVVAHIRHATVGVHSAHNSHPFTFGRWSFAHNGTLRGFGELEAGLLEETDPDLQRRRQGQTDSELIFLWLLTRMRSISVAEPSPDPAFTDMMDLLAEALRELERRSAPIRGRLVTRLNWVLTNGRELYATRYRNSLYIMRQEGSWRCDICGRNHTHGIEYPDYRAVTIASEPISRREWRPVRDGTVIGVTGGIEVHSRPL